MTAAPHKATCTGKDFLEKINILENAVNNKIKLSTTELAEIFHKLQIIQSLANPHDLQLACKIYDQVIRDYHLF